jgi:hypothetical protein
MAIVVEHSEEGHAFGVQRPIQKLLYAILITSRKLHQYFDEYRTSVLTDSHWRTYSTIGMPLDAYPSG